MSIKPRFSGAFFCRGRSRPGLCTKSFKRRSRGPCLRAKNDQHLNFLLSRGRNSLELDCLGELQTSYNYYRAVQSWLLILRILKISSMIRIVSRRLSPQPTAGCSKTWPCKMTVREHLAPVLPWAKEFCPSLSMSPQELLLNPAPQSLPQSKRNKILSLSLNRSNLQA